MISVGDPHVEADDYVHWFPRTCCSEHARFDKRTVGLFKLEWQGDCLISLCSKTYIIPRSKVAKNFYLSDCCLSDLTTCQKA